MKHGVKISKNDRDPMAVIAAGIADILTFTEAKEAIQSMFDVSEPTARNLITRGRYLARMSGERV